MPVEHPITFNLLFISIKALNNLPPCYNVNVLLLCNPNRSLRSSSKFQHQVPPSNLETCENRTFAVCAPRDQESE